MAKIELYAFVTVTPLINAATGETAAPYLAQVTSNECVGADGIGGWYVVKAPETGEEHEALARIVRKVTPIIIPGYNDDQLTPEEIRASEDTGITARWCDDCGGELNPDDGTHVEAPEEASAPAETRWCVKCLADREVTSEYTTLSKSDPTAAYVLACGHHTIDL